MARAGGELTTAECRRIAEKILAENPAPLFVLLGGEPLVRDDLEEIAAHASAKISGGEARASALWVGNSLRRREHLQAR